MRGILLLVVFVLIPTAVANTECFPATPLDCTIHIRINIAFSYNDSEISQAQIDSWVKEIEDVWNGGGGYQTYGDCACKVKFQVNAMKITDPAQANCNPGPPGYHCVMVTDYNKNKPKNEAGNETYRGYMYGVAGKDQSINGWWSDEMGEPHPDSPTGENALDAAHEAGHMLGLDDDYDKGPPERHGKNIMGTTYGDDAKPTQEQIDTVVEKNCGEGACPDECCCGNGEVEDDKGEMCDPLADPTGCGDDTTLYCCRICCQCHRQQCMPELGSYATKEDCESACKDGTCYFNYNTGCWDCKEHDVVETPSPKSSEPAGPASPMGSIPGIAGILALIAGGFFVVGGVKAEKKSFMGFGAALCMVSFLMIMLAMMETVDKPVDIKKAADSTGGAEPIGSIRAIIALDPTPAKNPDEEVLKDKNTTSKVEEPAPGGNDSHQEDTEKQDTSTPICGDGSCDVNESCSTCSKDCRECPPVCGNQRCESGETCASCKKDCGSCPPVCGDGDCESPEDCSDCPGDCGTCGPECGNGMCEAGENCECSDCSCPPGLYCSPTFPDADPMGCSQFGGPTCGNGFCDETEYCYTCPPDCPCGPETCCSPANPGIGCGSVCR